LNIKIEDAEAFEREVRENIAREKQTLYEMRDALLSAIEMENGNISRAGKMYDDNYDAYISTGNKLYRDRYVTAQQRMVEAQSRLAQNQAKLTSVMARLAALRADIDGDPYTDGHTVGIDIANDMQVNWGDRHPTYEHLERQLDIVETMLKQRSVMNMNAILEGTATVGLEGDPVYQLDAHN